MVICNLGEENAVTTNGQENPFGVIEIFYNLIVMMLL